MKICFIASSGGHIEQLKYLAKSFQDIPHFFVTEDVPYLKSEEFEKIPQINREDHFLIIKLLHVLFKSIYIFFKNSPDIIITTGALSVIPMCLIAKLFNKKIIFIESFAKINSPTRTGKFIYKFADRFYIQWKDLYKYYPNAIYKGSIY